MYNVKNTNKRMLENKNAREFIQLVYNECKDQKFGDHYVRVHIC